LLKDMADEGLIDGKRTAFHRMGGVPRVTVLRVIEIEDGEAIAIPDTWQPDDATPPPRLRLIERGKAARCGSGDRVLARTEEAGPAGRPSDEEASDRVRSAAAGRGGDRRAGKGWLPPSTSASPCDADFRSGRGEAGATGAGRAGRAAAARGVKVDHGAGRSAGAARLQPDRDPQIRHSQRFSRV
jgi:ribonuclease R